MKPTDKLEDHFRIDLPHQKALKRLHIDTVEELLYHLPARYEDISDVQAVEGLQKDQEAIVYGQLGGLKARRAWKSKRPIAEGWVEDGSARIKVMWFNQPYLAKMLTDGMYVKMVGKVTGSEGKLYIANPEVEKLDALPIDRHDSLFVGTDAEVDDTLYPVYRESKGVTSKWLYHTALKCFEIAGVERDGALTLPLFAAWFYSQSAEDESPAGRVQPACHRSRRRGLSLPAPPAQTMPTPMTTPVPG